MRILTNAGRAREAASGPGTEIPRSHQCRPSEPHSRQGCCAAPELEASQQVPAQWCAGPQTPPEICQRISTGPSAPSRCWFERPVALAERRPEELGPALDPVDGMTGPDFNLIMAPYAPPVRTRRRKPSTSPSRMVPPQQFHKHRSTLTADHPGELPLATLSGTATQLHSLNPTLAVCAHSPAP